MAMEDGQRGDHKKRPRRKPDCGIRGWRDDVGEGVEEGEVCEERHPGEETCGKLLALSS
jgi:hypothetical protein